MPRVLPDEWRPVGIPGLESDAEVAVRSLANTLVVAGPGAGKTETLAQRACYLLQTGLCPAPRRILAISMKRDAARNLQDRVALRCGPELSRRFDSMTFDAFAKSLVDRFRGALPEYVRPKRDYQISFDIQKRMRQLIDSLTPAESGLTTAQLQSLADEPFYWQHFIGRPLPPTRTVPKSVEEAAAAAIWWKLLNGFNTSYVNFPMLGRLAELLLRQNPHLLTTLRATYAYAFLDEFQDTTATQYELTKTAFRGSKTVVTAVGDNKQRIMAWAGALDGIFADFYDDFSSILCRPRVNHRSAPELVRIQRHLIAAMDGNSVLPEPSEARAGVHGECRCLMFPNHDVEAAHLAELIEGWMKTEAIGPRDICVLTRNRPDNYAAFLGQELQRRGIRWRIESELQDVLTEPVTTTLLAFLKLASSSTAGAFWTQAVDAVLRVRGGDEATQGRGAQDALSRFLLTLRSQLAAVPADQAAVRSLLQGVVEFLGEQAFRLQHPQYCQGNLFETTLDACAQHLAAYRGGTPDWAAAITAFEGGGTIPVMTMHKSKGLEYEIVVFVGLEDSALFGFAGRPAEETNGFFVAFSRAKRRIVFTFCGQRPRRPGGYVEVQQRQTIGPLYTMLEAAGVRAELIPAASPIQGVSTVY